MDAAEAPVGGAAAGPPVGTTNRYIATADVLTFDFSIDSVNGTNVCWSYAFNVSFAQSNGSPVGMIFPVSAATTIVASDRNSCSSASSRSCDDAARPTETTAHTAVAAIRDNTAVR